MSEILEVVSRRRRRGSESMYTNKTHAAQMLTPSVASTTWQHTVLSASICCGTTLRINPISSSPFANWRIVCKKLCVHSRVGSAWQSRRVLLVNKKTSGTSLGTPKTPPSLAPL